jgi:hypothetical protein
MATQFPNLCPVRRDYAPGQYATQRFNAINGAGTTRLYGSKPFDANLNLEFSVTDDELQLILNCWDEAHGEYDTLSLPAQVFAGMDNEIQGQLSASLNWRWAERPTVSSQRPGFSRVQVKLIATLDIA